MLGDTVVVASTVMRSAKRAEKSAFCYPARPGENANNAPRSIPTSSYARLPPTHHHSFVSASSNRSRWPPKELGVRLGVGRRQKRRVA